MVENHKALHLIFWHVILSGQISAGLLIHVCPGLSPTKFFTFVLPGFYTEGYVIFLLDLALLIFNIEMCVRTNFKGIFTGDPYII